METEYDYLFKIVLIGDAGVGKTSIVRRYTDGIFTSAGIPTIGVDFCIKTLQIGSSAVKVCVCCLSIKYAGGQLQSENVYYVSNVYIPLWHRPPFICTSYITMYRVLHTSLHS